MKNIIKIGLMTLVSLPVFSQMSENAWYYLNNRNIDLEQKWEAFGLSKAQYEAAINQVYDNPEFIEGSIYKDDKLMKTDVPMRYNAYSDEIEISNNPGEGNETYGALLKDPTVFVKIFKTIYVFVPHEGSNDNGHYFNILTEGKTYHLYKMTKATFDEPFHAKTSYERNRPASFPKTTTYYLVSGGTFSELPKSHSKIIKAMGVKKKEVKEFIKVNKLNLNKEADLIKTVTYFDSLMQ